MKFGDKLRQIALSDRADELENILMKAEESMVINAELGKFNCSEKAVTTIPLEVLLNKLSENFTGVDISVALINEDEYILGFDWS